LWWKGSSIPEQIVVQPPNRFVRHSTLGGNTPVPVTSTPAPALPPESHPVWAGLIKGIVQHDFSYTAAGMLLFNLNLQWRREPARLPLLVEQARAFFQRYHHLLAGDIQKLFS
jgi:hypothetical protein